MLRRDLVHYLKIEHADQHSGEWDAWESLGGSDRPARHTAWSPFCWCTSFHLRPISQPGIADQGPGPGNVFVFVFFPTSLGEEQLLGAGGGGKTLPSPVRLLDYAG